VRQRRHAPRRAEHGLHAVKRLQSALDAVAAALADTSRTMRPRRTGSVRGAA
jgi:hypothetical protein